MNLENKKCFVTGASSGIGLSIVKLLLNAGAYVFGVSLDEIHLEHSNLTKYTCDLTDNNTVIESFKKAIDELNTIDIYVTSAGQARYGFSKDINQKDFDLLVDLNFKAVIKGLHLMASYNNHKPFVFVAISSVMAFWPLPGYTTYAATKAAMTTYVKGFRNELNKHQKLLLVYPVATDTNFFNIAGQKHRSWMIQSPEHVAKCVLKGIKKGKPDIYPSKTFKVIHQYLPFLLKPYIKFEINLLNDIN